MFKEGEQTPISYQILVRALVPEHGEGAEDFSVILAFFPELNDLRFEFDKNLDKTTTEVSKKQPKLAEILKESLKSFIRRAVMYIYSLL